MSSGADASAVRVAWPGRPETVRSARSSAQWIVTCTVPPGVKSRSVIDKVDLDAALVEMIESDGPFLLNVHVPHQEHVLPMIPAGMTVKDIIKA